MSETSQVPAPVRAQRATGMSNGLSYSTLNKSPTKQAFNTLKNFLRSKSSISDLRMWSDSKKEDVREYPGYPEPLVLGRLHESKSSSRLSDFKFKGPRRKRSLGCLVPPPHGEHFSKHQFSNHEYPNSSSESVHDTRPFIVPIPAPQKFHSAASSPQLNLIRNSTSTKTSTKTSPTKASFSLDGNTSYSTYNGYNSSNDTDQLPPSTPCMSDSYAFSREWVAPNTIRGTYIHDWTDNASPRSLTESLKVGKVETPSMRITQSSNHTPTRNHNGNASISSLGQVSTSDKTMLSSDSFLLDAVTHVAKSAPDQSKLKLDLRDLSKPSNPHPSPCTIDNKQEPILKLGEPIIISSKATECNTRSESTSDSDTASISSRHSQGSQFSFMPNRTPSIRFYKSNEQVALEKAMDDDRLDRIKFKEFLGTSEDVENDLLDMCSNGKVTDGLDEAVNYIDYEEEDDTDALFNRDLFGLGDSHGSKGLGLELDDDEFNPRSTVLELGKDEFDDSDNDQCDYATDIDYSPRAKGLELHEDSSDNDRTPRVKDAKIFSNEFKIGYSASTEFEKRNMPSCLKDDEQRVADEVLFGSMKAEREENPLTVKDDINLKKVNAKDYHNISSSEVSKNASSRDILQILNHNDQGLVFRPQSQEIQMQHQPSASIHRHRSLKFHHLASNIEDSRYLNGNTPKKFGTQEEIWEDSALDEVNLIPEDYEYDSDYENAFDDRSNHSNERNMKSNRFSTMVSSTDELNFGIGDAGQSIISNEPHLWKNLINKTAEYPSDAGSVSRSRSIQHVERIQLDNRTITLFNRPREEINQDISNTKEEHCLGNNENSEESGLSVIME